MKAKRFATADCDEYCASTVCAIPSRPTHVDSIKKRD